MSALESDFIDLFEHRLSDEQMTELLLSLRLDEHLSTEAIATAAKIMQRYAVALEVDASLKDRLIDVVGTGGDKSGTFNVSTTVAILLAATGEYVAKHGNRSITSKSGSADVLEALGIRLDLSLAQSKTLLEECGFTFMFAQNHHPAMKFIMPIRKAIGVKSVFNVLGPLTNPAGVKRYLLGVFEPSFVMKMAEALRMNDVDSAIVVSSNEKMDEISISDITHAVRLDAGKIEAFEIDPQHDGFSKHPLSAVLGGDCNTNAHILTTVLEGKSTQPQRDMVLINAAYALVAARRVRDIQEAKELLEQTIATGKAKAKLQQIIKVSQSL